MHLLILNRLQNTWKKIFDIPFPLFIKISFILFWSAAAVEKEWWESFSMQLAIERENLNIQTFRIEMQCKVPLHIYIYMQRLEWHSKWQTKQNNIFLDILTFTYFYDINFFWKKNLYILSIHPWHMCWFWLIK